MPRYIFLLDRRDNSFPERYRVVEPGEDAEAVRASESLTDTVAEGDADAFFDRLEARHPPDDPVIAEQAYASRWATVERSYAGLFRD